MNQPTAITPDYADFTSPTGSRLIHARIDRHDGHTTITVAHADTLNRQFANPAEADAYLAFLKAEVEAGTGMWQIEQMAGALTSVTAVFDQAEQELIDRMAADLDATVTAREAKARQLTDDAREIATGTEWNRLRQSHRPVRNTRTQAFRKPPTAAMLRLMRAHSHGIVVRDDNTNWTVLAGIVDRGLAEVHTCNGRHVVESVRLNARGWAAIAEQVAA